MECLGMRSVLLGTLLQKPFPDASWELSWMKHWYCISTITAVVMEAKPCGYDVGNAAVYSKAGFQVKPSDLAALECPLCTQVLRNPVQVISCGHRFCKGCLELMTSARYVCWHCSIHVNCVADSRDLCWHKLSPDFAIYYFVVLANVLSIVI